MRWKPAVIGCPTGLASHGERRSQLARRLEKAGCEKFIVGRRRSKSRFEWAYSCISLGKAAAGETSAIDQINNGVSEMDDEQPAPLATVPVSSGPATLTIAEAKDALSRPLGVPPSSIETIVREWQISGVQANPPVRPYFRAREGSHKTL